MEIPETKTCPLGHTCVKTTESGIERCAWHMKIQGMNPQTDEPMDRWECAIVWSPIMMIEQAREQNVTSSTLQEFRNETADRQERFLTIVEGAKADAQNIEHN